MSQSKSRRFAVWIAGAGLVGAAMLVALWSADIHGRDSSLQDSVPSSAPVASGSGEINSILLYDLVEADIFAWVAVDDIGNLRANTVDGSVPLPTEELKESAGLLYKAYTLTITDVIGVNKYNPPSPSKLLNSIDDVNSLTGAVIADIVDDDRILRSPRNVLELDGLEVGAAGLVFLKEFGEEYYDDPPLSLFPMDGYVQTIASDLSVGGDEYRVFSLIQWFDVTGAVATSRFNGISVQLDVLEEYILGVSAD